MLINPGVGVLFGNAKNKFCIALTYSYLCISIDSYKFRKLQRKEYLNSLNLLNSQ